MSGPAWSREVLESRGLLASASLNRIDISSQPVDLAGQFLVVAVFHTGEGHHVHPGLKAWNDIADAYQVAPAMAFGGETIVRNSD